MTLADFKEALARTKLSLDGRATYGALLVLVDGREIEGAALGAGCSRQAVDAAARKIKRTLRKCPFCGAKLKFSRDA